MTMDKRYQVFVSSTYEDLQDERKEVMQALLELDCIPAGMELFPASNDDQWTLIKRVIDDCDYYLLIIGGRYGSTNEKGISYTQMEFEYALQKGKPIISFLHKNPEKIESGKSEQDPEKKKKLEEFRSIAKKKIVKFWENPENLGSVVSRSMVKLIKNFPAEGWVKSNGAVDEASLKEISRLQKENQELQERIREISTEAPKGTEGLSQGEDLVELQVRFEAKKKGTYDRYDCKDSIMVTWNTIFKTIAPLMINESSELQMENMLDALSKKYVDITSWKENNKNLTDFSLFRITKESFNLIKVQLRALGLMRLSTKKRSAKDTHTYWTLTPYGDYVMTQLLALRK